MELKEVKKIYNFIYERKYLVDENGIFDRDTLFRIKSSIVADEQDGIYFEDFKLTTDQEKILITSFLEYAKYNDDTPSLFLENEECIKAVIMKNYKDQQLDKFLKFIKSEKEDFIIKNLLENVECYCLSNNSPDYLKRDIDIVLLSLKNDVSTVEYLNDTEFKKEDKDKIADVLIQNNYIINNKTPEFLRNNRVLALIALKNQQFNNEKNQGINYLSENIIKECLKGPDGIKLYFQTGFLLNKKNWFLQLPLTYYKYKESIKNFIGSHTKKYSDFISEILNCCPNINTFHNLFEIIIDEKLDKYKLNPTFPAIFYFTLVILMSENNYDKVKQNHLIKDIINTLSESNEFLLATQKYYEIYHSDEINKLELIELYRDIIAKYVSLYISKYKENNQKKLFDELNACIKPYFKLNENNEYIKEQIKYIKQKERFKSLYDSKDASVISFINHLIDKYNEIPLNILNKMLDSFSSLKKSKLRDIIDEPLHYKDYLRYLEASKLITRLNLKNISYYSPEMTNYRDIIVYNKEQDKYYYEGINFNNELLEKYTEYQNYEKLFNEIKKEIIAYIKDIKITRNRKTTYTYYGLTFTEKALKKAKEKYPHVFIDIESEFIPKEITSNLSVKIEKELSKKLPFTDEYFIFDLEKNLEKFNGKKLIDFFDNLDRYVVRYRTRELEFDNSKKRQEEMNLLKNYASVAIWTVLFNKERIILENEFDRKLLNFIVYDEIIMLVEKYNINMHNLKKLFDNLANIYIDNAPESRASAILGKELLKSLESINESLKLVCTRAKNDKRTVPFIEGKTDVYQYSMYDTLDESILLSGVNTESSVGIDGYDRSFFHYCAISKNGFIIKITDFNNKFIAKASGFRNGNCVFINQLRTIYDNKRDYYDKNKIIETFKKACEDIINISQNNEKETTKIEYVLVTKSCILKDYIENIVDNEVYNKIGLEPVCTEGIDWNKFLQYDGFFCGMGSFNINYTNFPIICIAKYKKGKMEPEDIKFGDVEALYERKRNKIIVSKVTEEVIRKINKIKGINSYFNNISFTPIKITNNSSIVIGDNWYIIYDDNVIVEELCLDFDKKAVDEFNITKEVINNHLDINKINEEVKARLLSKNINGV